MAITLRLCPLPGLVRSSETCVGHLTSHHTSRICRSMGERLRYEGASALGSVGSSVGSIGLGIVVCGLARVRRFSFGERLWTRGGAHRALVVGGAANSPALSLSIPASSSALPPSSFSAWPGCTCWSRGEVGEQGGGAGAGAAGAGAKHCRARAPAPHLLQPLTTSLEALGSGERVQAGGRVRRLGQLLGRRARREDVPRGDALRTPDGVVPACGGLEVGAAGHVEGAADAGRRESARGRAGIGRRAPPRAQCSDEPMTASDDERPLPPGEGVHAAEGEGESGR